MPPLRFRAWHKTQKVMRTVTSLDMNEDGSLNSISFIPQGDDHRGWYVREHDFVVMQSTGLTDGKGVTIFEGDIVRLTWKERLDFSGSSVGAVEWGAFDDGEYYEYDTWLFVREVEAYGRRTPLKSSVANANMIAEVIGNIYQYPELLSA